MKPVLALLLVLAVATPAHGGGRIGVYFDPQGVSPSREVSAGEYFKFYVVADGIYGGLMAYEFSLEVDPRIQVYERILPGDRSFDVASGPDDWVVGTGVCGDRYPAVLVEYRAYLDGDSQGLLISLGPASNSSSSTGRPAYVTCETTTVTDFEEMSGAVINPDQRSWGAVKLLYE